MNGVMMRRLLPAFVVASMAAAGVVGATVASAGVSQPAVVSANPANFTPNLFSDVTVSHPATYAVEQSGTTMYIGGQFHAVENSARTASYIRPNFAAFDAATGAVSAVAPAFNGNVWAIRAAGGSLYVAGEFTTVTVGATTVTRRAVVKLNPATGAVDPTFAPAFKYGTATDLQVVNGQVIVGGTFPGGLVSLDPVTGARTGYLGAAVGVSGSCVGDAACGQSGISSANEGPHVYRFAVNSSGTRLVAIGNFTAPHPRAYMVDLTATTSSLDPWYYQPLSNRCLAASAYPAYLRGVDFAPDGQHFEIAATGYVVADSTGINRDICDAVARFPTTHNPLTADAPNWINYTGGDTLHSVVDTGSVVYVNGHNRWLDNPYGKDTCGTNLQPGCSPRPGIGAIDPATGHALAWNPGKTRGVGGKDLLSTTSGLWIASDGQHIAGEYHYGIAFMTLATS